MTGQCAQVGAEVTVNRDPRDQAAVLREPNEFAPVRTVRVRVGSFLIGVRHSGLS